jgi:hypothetical protein
LVQRQLIRLEVFRSRAIASDRTEQDEKPEDPAIMPERSARLCRMSSAVTGEIMLYWLLPGAMGFWLDSRLSIASLNTV